MNETLQLIVEALENIKIQMAQNLPSDESWSERSGNLWSNSLLGPGDLWGMADSLVIKIKTVKIKEVEFDVQETLKSIPFKIETFRKNTFQYLFTAQHKTVLPIYLALIQYIDIVIQPLFSWEQLKDQKLLPQALTKKLNAIDAELTELVPNKENLSLQIQNIKDASDVADNLPINLQMLKENKAKVETLYKDSGIMSGKIEDIFNDLISKDRYIKETQVKISKLLEECENVYQIATTKGLAASFELRARSLTRSMYLWVGALLTALIIGGFIGSARFEAVHLAIKDKQEPAFIWIQIFLSIISFGAPIWLAWISTKQISQRFKLSEDYAFKASIAKAYQGYKKEAATVDEQMAGRLFSSALDRLEEAPLRLMEDKHYSSPWQELLNSKAVTKAFDAAPDLQNDFMDVLKKLATNAPKPAVKNVKAPSVESNI